MIHIDIIHIKRVFRQLQLALAQHLGTIDHRMHQQVMSLCDQLDIVPAKGLVYREHRSITHHLFMLGTDLVIHKIRDKQIDRIISSGELAQLVEHLQKCILIHPVITVHNLIIQSGRMLNPCIDRRTVSAVLLMNRADDRRVTLGIGIGDLRCRIL